MNVVTPRKICFRNLNFSFPRIAAGTPSSHPGHSEQLICHRDCPTPWTHGQEFHSIPVLSASFHKHSAIPSGNQIDPGGITASETPTPHPATHQCSSDIPITSQTIPVTPQVLRESLACKAGNPCTCSCSQIPSPSGAGGNWSSFPAQSVLPWESKGGKLASNHFLKKARGFPGAPDGKPSNLAWPGTGDYREESNKTQLGLGIPREEFHTTLDFCFKNSPRGR